MSMKPNIFKRALSMLMTLLMVLSCWVWFEPIETSAANITGDSNYLFAYFTGTSIEGQTIHLAVSQDGLNYTALRNNEPVIIPSKGTGNVRDPYLWYNENDGYYYILATDLDFTDEGGTYCDNSESFIVWRSKDLVNWYDETMIDVKAILGRLGINNNNMQAVWAPQVLWDGTSFVVYFSLQCDGTSNGSWNPLTIVYLRATNLLDESSYYQYGVIHNPGRHVIDADIIQKPGTSQYYMFYKDEAASGGVQSIYYMVSDNGPTGPYYAPGNANDGRGPQLFSWVGKNLEGCNSFFNDQNELVTYVDEYDYTNASGQTEAHFHVCKTSDFTNYTKVEENTYNINSLSPRHGSVVKITDAEYNRLLEYTNEITSSSFPETEKLSDHLVGRYFTTADYTYNAANGKNDLTLTDGTISVSTDTSGDYYAYFNAAGAEINLAQLISGDLNIKDGFTITFSATTPTSTGSNTRFFDISNNWSQRTDSSECYLHMSPVADSNGLYVGAYNGPVTTSSWVWASQGRNYNDGVMHDYIISFADGNMMLYIDGALAMKRDRYNMNREYGDNFLKDNWYNTIGNSVMRIGKSEWADPLFTGSMQNLCIYDCSLSYYDVQKMQKLFDDQAGKTAVSKIVVPETVYMTPSTGESKTSQYYVNNKMHSESNNVQLDNSINKTGGIMEFYIPGAKHFIVEVNTKTSGIGDIVLTENGNGVTSYNSEQEYENKQYDADANGYFTYDKLGFYINGTGLTAGKTALAEWKITVIMNDGSQTTHYAYTTLYAPWYLPVGAATRANASDGDLYDQSIAWVSGVHGYTANSSGSYWIAATNQTLSDEGEYNEKGTYYANTNMLPLISSIGTAGTTTAVKNWLSTSAPSGVPNPTIRYFSLNAKNSNYGCLVADISPVANITVDTSRYTNFNQIPNLTVGYNITDIEKSKGVIWYVSDFTNIANTSSSANGGTIKFYNYTKQESSKNISSNYANNQWFSGDNGVAGNIIYGSSTENCGSSYSAVSSGVEYNSAWNRTIITGTDTYDYMFKGAAHAHRNSDYRTYSINFVQLRATNVDKTKLRNLVLKATYFNQSDYTTASWSTFQTALQNAAFALGNPTNSDIATVKTNLENAMNALQTTVTLNANGGTINGSATTASNVTVGTETSLSFKVSGYIPVRTGYVFKGWATTDDADSGSTTTITTGLMPTLYATWELYRANITFDNLIDFKSWNYIADSGVVSDVTDTGFTVTTKDGFGESYSWSPFFDVTPGKSYKVDVDVSGSGWDVYFFFCDANGNWIDFDDTANRYSSNGTGNSTRVFTAPNKDSVVKAQIRVDSNGSGNTVKFNNIRVYEDTGITVSPVNKVITYGSAYGDLPTPTRYGYDFAGWYNNGTAVDASTVVNVETTINLTSSWKLNNDALTDDIVIVDFGMAVKFEPFANDTILKNGATSYTITGVSGGTYGSFSVSGNVVTYTPDKIINGVDSATYTVSYDNGAGTLTGDIKIFPATVVYYEDDDSAGAVKYTNGKASQGDTGIWSTTGSSKLGKVTTDLSDKVYGYDNAYNNTDNFSMNAAHVVTVSAKNNPSEKYNGVAKDAGSWPVAEFTFAGTGFDIVSLISKNTGAIEVIVTDANGKKVYDWVVDTYYGYSYDSSAKDWVVTSKNNALYQIPVISRNDLAYGTYTVQIIPTYTSRYDHQADGSYDFYLDAIRVYNPMGSDLDASTVYLGDGEYVLAHQNIRDILVNAGSFGNGENGVVYLESGLDGNFADYKLSGPKNEVYLAKGQSIAFNMTVSGMKPSSVQISAHALSGTAQLRIGSGKSYSGGIDISHTTTLYYDTPFTSDIYWEVSENGYTLNTPLVITNTGDGVLALCNIKVTTDMATANEPVMFMIDDDDFNSAVYTMNTMADLTEDDGALFVPDDMATDSGSDVVEVGETVVVSIETSKEVYALTVNGENAVLVSENEDGSKTWSYTYVTETRGEQTFTLVAYDIHGYASEETTVTVDVQSRIEIFFNKLSNFFRMIIDFLDNLFGN